MCQMMIKHYICPVLRPRKGISELESTGDSNDCKTGGSVRLYPRIPFALAMGVCQINILFSALYYNTFVPQLLYRPYSFFVSFKISNTIFL